ncbi:MAG: hypothetical protein NDI73_07045 [Desulfuromonadales bacterium]|nr:hypothetical protein [Desulfuromonadales bacterium]
MIGRVVVLAGLLLLGAACARPVLPPPADLAFAALGLRSIAVGPIGYATHQPGEMCSTFIDEDLRSALVRELRRRGYDAFAVGNRVPRSFSAGSPSPLPGDPPPAGSLLSAGGEGLLQVWIEEYWENTLCGWEGPKYLTMGAVGILYAGSPPREVWRSRSRAEEHGDYRAHDLIWITTERVTDRLLASLPAGPGWTGPR